MQEKQQVDLTMAFKRYKELATRALYQHTNTFTLFLDPLQLEQAMRAGFETGVANEFYGGYPDAERSMAVFKPEEASAADWPIACIKLNYNRRYGELKHRDVLGAAIGLGIGRELLGDILLDQEYALLFCTQEIAPFLLANFESAGSVHVKPQLCDGAQNIPPPRGHFIRATVPSMRLDAVLAAGHRISRQKAQNLIGQQRVRVNYKLETRNEFLLKANDLVSVRGLGRIKILEEQGITRKGRQAVTIFVYDK